MAIGGGNTIRNDVITTYKADVVGHTSGLTRIGAAEDRLTAQMQDAAAKRSAAWKSFQGNALAAVGGITAAIAIGQKGFQEYRRDVELAAATVGMNLKKLQEASGGLRTQDQLLEMAAKGLHGRWQLNSEQMVIVEKGMRALVAQGKNAAEVEEAMGAAIEKGQIKPLKSLGLVYDEGLAKIDARAAALQALSRTSVQMSGNLAREGDEAKRMGIKFADALDDIWGNIGKLVVSLTPLAQAVATIAGGAAQIVGAAMSFEIGGVSVGDALGKAVRYNPITGFPTAVYDAGSYLGGMFGGGGGGSETIDFFSRQAQKGLDAQNQDVINAIVAQVTGQPLIGAGAMIEGVGKATPQRLAAVAKALAEYKKKMAVLDDLGLLRGTATGAITAPGFDNTDEELLRLAGETVEGEQWSVSEGTRNEWKAREEEAAVARSMAAAQELLAATEQRESLLESIFGPVEEFDLYTTAWQGLETVVTAGFEAWITGSKSVGAALKEALHGFAKNLASEAFLQAMRHTAYGLGSLAIGGPLAGASAGAHFKAAAVWGGVAAAAGLITHATRPTASASGGNAAAGIGGGARGGGGGITGVTVVVGDGFADSSPRYVARRTRRAMDLANHYGDYGGSQSG